MSKWGIRRLNFHGALLQGTFWFGFCTYIAFMVATLMDYGWSASAAAGVMTVMSVIVLFANPLSGFISDKYLSEKKTTIALMVGVAICLFLLPFSLRSGSNVLVIVNMVGIAISGMQIGGFIDAWIVGLKQEFPDLNYGVMRGTGSLWFSIAAQTMGMVTISLGHDARFWLGGVFILLGIITAVTFRPAKQANSHDEKSPSQLKGKEAFKLIFSSKAYCLLLVLSFFLMLSSMSMGTLMQIVLPEYGGTSADIGTAFAIMSGSEVPIMFAVAFLLNQFGFKKLLVFCSAIFVVRMLMSAGAETANVLIFVQITQGLSFGVLLPISMSYLSQIIDVRVRSTAITTFTAVTASLTGILGNLITTALLAWGFTVQNAMVVFAVLSSIGFGLALYGVARKIFTI
ncbi:MAG: MFS transporter [Defluviitaleaceae bacterium]|nr:MFS transporter [Defluviitaleaceae bacterium]